MKLKVYYGFSKLTPKAVRKTELAVYFENSIVNPVKKREFIERRMNIVHERNQTVDEMNEAQYQTRIFSKYGFFIDASPYFGNIDLVLLKNFDADKKQVAIEERKLIYQKLKKAYYKVYDKKPDNEQLNVFQQAIETTEAELKTTKQ